jgi:zeta-carotene desaturase
MPQVLVLGGGLAGLASGVALAQAGTEVTILEARPYVGGRAASYEIPAPGQGPNEPIDNCQHILLRCCVNLLDFYRRLEVDSLIEFHRRFFWIEPGGRTSIMEAGPLPAPFHFTGSFARLHFLSLADKLTIGRAMLAILRERLGRQDLDRITMLDWLREKGQTSRAIERFWRQVLVSAVNEELDRMAASHGFQVIWLGFLARRDTYEMGVPGVPLGELYRAAVERARGRLIIETRTPVERLELDRGQVAGLRAGGRSWQATHYVSALPFERLAPLHPDLPAILGLQLDAFEHSPITGVHLWFDRPVTPLPHGTLLDRTVQWFYSRAGGAYLKLVVSASRSLNTASKQQIIDLCLRELKEFLPGMLGASLTRAHVVKEMRATFSARPGLESLRPEATTPLANFSLAGDWTRSGWPATMEGAVRSGYRAAEAASAVLGRPAEFLLPDIA